MSESSLPDLSSDVEVRACVRRALDEDVRTGDVTTLALVPDDAAVTAIILAREACVVAGGAVAALVFSMLDPDCRVDTIVAEGHRAVAGETLLRIRGRAGAVLTGERTALNFMQRMTGIATLTRRHVDAVAGYAVSILDTRKTTPGLRIFEKYAVRCGGACNHRMGLHDRAMIKDNHRRLWRGGDGARLDQAIAAVRKAFPGIAVEVEVETEAELESALRAAPEWILLDNMPPETMRRCVARVAGRCRIEASGGISMTNLVAVAACGVDAISLGCLTHSAPSVDLSLEVEA